MSIKLKVATTYKVECNDNQSLCIEPDTMIELANEMGLDNMCYLQCPNDDNLQVIHINVEEIFKFIEDMKRESQIPNSEFLDDSQMDVVEKCCEQACISKKNPMLSLANYLDNFFSKAVITNGFINLIYE